MVAYLTEQFQAEGRQKTGSFWLPAASLAAAGELRRRGADAVVLVGASMGGTAVLAAAARIRPPGS